jgi:cytochrome c556
MGVVCLATLVATISAQPQKYSPTKEFMRQKLEHAKRVLEGITMEDFALVAKHARKLKAMSQEASWRTFENPEYLRHTESFRRAVDALAAAADEQNLDGATLAYVKVTMSCVDCHKFVRGKKVAQLGGRAPPLPGSKRVSISP